VNRMLDRDEAQMAELAVLGEQDSAARTTAPPDHDRSQLRVLEALLFAAAEPVDASALARVLPRETDIAALLAVLKAEYSSRGVNLVQVAGKWQFRTAGDLAFLLHKETAEQHKLSRAAIETLAIIAYHQPVTRADIEAIRGVTVSKGTIDLLLEAGWIRIRGRRRTPGRPVTYGTTDAFLAHFGLDAISDLPGVDELKAAGFLDSLPPSALSVPQPSDELTPDEEPYDEDDATDAGAEITPE
jgi:segregation and condensation protein B